jgi:hypothetical protein
LVLRTDEEEAGEEGEGKEPGEAFHGEFSVRLILMLILILLRKRRRMGAFVA